MYSRIKQEAVIAGVLALCHAVAIALALGASAISRQGTAPAESDRRVSPADTAKFQPIPVSTFVRSAHEQRQHDQPAVAPDATAVKKSNAQSKTARNVQATQQRHFKDTQEGASNDAPYQQSVATSEIIPPVEHSRTNSAKPPMQPPQQSKPVQQRLVNESNSVEVELRPLERMSEQAIAEAVHGYNTKLQNLNVVLTFNQLTEDVVSRLGYYFILRSTVGDRQFVDRTGRVIDPSSKKLGHYSINMKGHVIPPGVASAMRRLDPSWIGNELQISLALSPRASVVIHRSLFQSLQEKGHRDPQPSHHYEANYSPASGTFTWTDKGPTK